MKFFSLILIIFLTSSTSFAEDLVLSEHDQVPVKKALFFKDDTLKLTPQEIVDLDTHHQIQWTPISKLNLGYKSYRAWFKFTLNNQNDTDNWIFENTFPLIQELSFTMNTTHGLFSRMVGRKFPFDDREIKTKDLLIPFTLKKGESSTVYLGYKSNGPIMANPVFLSPGTLAQSTAQNHLYYGLYYGAIAIIILNHLFLWFAVKEWVYFLYAAYAFTYVLANSCLSGLAYQYLWPDHIEWNQIAAFFLLNLSQVCVNILIMFFLKTKIISKLAHRITQCLIGSWLFVIAAQIILHNNITSSLTAFGGFFGTILQLVVAAVAFRKKSKNTTLFLIAFSGVLIGNSMYALRAFGIIPDNLITNHGMEIGSLLEVMLLSFALITNIKQREQELQKIKAAKQIGHDIQSPIAALIFAQDSIDYLNESDREMLKISTQTLSDFAYELSDAEFKTQNQIERPQLILGLLERELKSKRIEYSQIPNFLELKSDTNLFLFVKVQADKFRRIISNLINNSVEHGKATRVSIHLSENENQVVILISDNGTGIRDELIKEFHSGIFKSTKGGKGGMGLKDAAENIKKWKGVMDIKGRKGTQIKLTFPKAGTPQVYLTNFVVGPKAVLYVLDDDVSVHSIWEKRFSELEAIKTHHVYSYDKLPKEASSDPNSIFLIDYELRKQDLNGIQVIQSLGIRANSILVTSHFDDPPVISECQRIGIQILPKSFVGRIPIQFNGKLTKTHNFSDLYFIMIDDMKANLIGAEIMAKRFGKKIITLQSFYEFKKIMNDVPKETRICVDYYLSDGETGYTVTKLLYQEGFTNLHIITCENPENIPSMKWVCSILDKMDLWKNLPIKKGETISL